MLSPLGSLSWGLTLEGVKTEMWLEISHSNGSGHLYSTPLWLCDVGAQAHLWRLSRRPCVTPLMCRDLGHVLLWPPLGLAPFLSWWSCVQNPYSLPLKITIIFVFLQTSILPALEKTSNGCMIVCVCFLGTLGWNSARAGEMNSLERTFFSHFPLPCTSFLI